VVHASMRCHHSGRCIYLGARRGHLLFAGSPARREGFETFSKFNRFPTVFLQIEPRRCFLMPLLTPEPTRISPIALATREQVIFPSIFPSAAASSITVARALQVSLTIIVLRFSIP
jgi:hypothetical protein